MGETSPMLEVLKYIYIYINSPLCFGSEKIQSKNYDPALESI